MSTEWIFWVSLIFVLFHGQVLCDELHPIYQAANILQQQPEWSTIDVIEPAKAGTVCDGAIKGTMRGVGINQVPPKWAPLKGVRRVPLQGVPLKGVPPQVVPLQGVLPRGVPPQGVNPGEVLFQGVHPRGVPSQGVPLKGVPPRGVPPHEVSLQGVPPKGVHDKKVTVSRQPPLKDDTNEAYLLWMKEQIVDGYKFKKDDNKDLWIDQPVFDEEVLKSQQFEDDAKRIEEFFKQNNNWKVTKTTQPFRNGCDCTNLLYVTAARYLYVTYVLYVESDKKLIPCSYSMKDKSKMLIPASGVCYPKPYGTTSCTSDYDVGLIGKDAGILTRKFNEYFQRPVPEGFGKPSELVFDTNVYAFTLEYAMPYLFANFPDPAFATNLNREENTVKYRMQEVASAYYKVFKYSEPFFSELVQGAKKSMNDPSKAELDKWLKNYERLNMDVPMKLGNGQGQSRKDHNDVYQERVEKMSKKGYQTSLLDLLAEALIYAAEAYHTRGAIRHVVGFLQMGKKRPLSDTDLWVSMIENWGETVKEYNHCEASDSIAKCLLSMSKYMWRVFNAMKMMHDRRNVVPALPHPLPFYQVFDPESLAKAWLAYKRKGKEAIANQQILIQRFLQYFNCFEAAKDISKKSLSKYCLGNMNAKINEYNKHLALKLGRLNPTNLFLSNQDL